MFIVKDAAYSNIPTDKDHPTLQSLLLQNLFWFHSRQLHCFAFLISSYIVFSYSRHLFTAQETSETCLDITFPAPNYRGSLWQAGEHSTAKNTIAI